MIIENHKLLPLKISISRDEYFFANLQWKLFKIFNKKRNIPCGRTKEDKFLCCCQPLDEEHCYLTADDTEARCKCCDSVKILCNKPIDLKKDIYCF